MVRVRFAPSPTGYLHLGNARTALFNWLYARHIKGTFILRIEDTDVERSEDIYMEEILNDLRWLGFSWDEGPDKGGPYAPYRQSERLALYQEYSERLLASGHAYHCYCSEEELAQRRKDSLQKGLPPRYDNRCRRLSPSEEAKFKAAGRNPVLRFKVPEGRIEFQDLIRGEVAFESKEIGDFIIMKSEGGPPFHFAVVLDDCLMKITHVIRGEDHLSNTPRHILLFQALGFEPPQFAHLPMIGGPGGEKLSKRTHAVSISQYRNLGYMPEAMINYLALLGWSDDTGKELMDVSELIEKFDIAKVNKSRAIFDETKLKWVNSHYIRKVDAERLTMLALPYLKEAGLVDGEADRTKLEQLKKIVELVRDHLSCISEIAGHAEVFLKKEIEIDDPLAKEVLKLEESRKVLKAALSIIEKTDTLTEEGFKGIVKEIGVLTRSKGKGIYFPLRAALTGTLHGPELHSVVPILGKDACLKRLQAGMKAGD